MSYKEKGFTVSFIKGVFTAVISALVGVLIFALIIKMANLSSGVVKPVNQFIKVISIFLGCFFAVSGKRGYIKGGLIGIISIIIIYLLFALISGANVFSSGFIIDLLFSLAVGVLSGILAVNFKK